jgi:hypothetical protein
MALQTDFMVVLEDRPGIAARVGEALGAAGVSIEGLCGFTSGGLGIMHVLIGEEHVEAARDALTAANVEIMTQRHVAVVPCANDPGALGRVMRRLASEEVNCDLVFLATEQRLAIGSDQMERVTALLGG